MRGRGGRRAAPSLTAADVAASASRRAPGPEPLRRRVRRAPARAGTPHRSQEEAAAATAGGGRGEGGAPASSAPGPEEEGGGEEPPFSDASSSCSSSSAPKGPAGGGPGADRGPASWLERSGKEEEGAGKKGKKLQLGGQTRLKPKSSCRKRDPPLYASGSLEEQWHLAILDKGRVTCPVCRAAARKTVEGLKKHMTNCQQEMLTCRHCGKQLRSLAGMKYHLMADHNSLRTGKEVEPQDQQSERERLRQVLRRLGKLKCTREGCTGSFTSIVGYLYHTQKCGKAAAELETLAARCPHCGKAYRSKAGLLYHVKSEHGPAPFLHEETQASPPKDASTEPSSGHRLQRRSAKVAAYYLHELAHVELAKEWPKRKVLQDLVPDDRKLKYTRPGLPAVSQEVLCKWRAEMKAYRQVQCPNQGCTSVYSSVSGLKSHLGSCSLGEFVAGKYRCLLCPKEFVSESGVKYHINAVHAEDWFEVSTAASKRLVKRVRQTQPGEPDGPKKKLQQQQKKPLTSRSQKRRLPPRAISPKRPPQPGPNPSQRPGMKASRFRGPGSESCGTSMEVAGGSRPLKLSHKRGRK